LDAGGKFKYAGGSAPELKETCMHLARTLAVKLLRRQEWGRRALALPRRRVALSPARKRRFAGAKGSPA
jgi:hypothetical protein